MKTPSFVIQGGKKLRGAIETSAGKNSPVALLCAAVLVRGKVVLRDMSRVEEVERMIEILESIGVSFKWRDLHTLFIDSAKPLQMDKIDKGACATTNNNEGLAPS